MTSTALERRIDIGFYSYSEKINLSIERSSLRLSSVRQSKLTKRQELIRLLLFGLDYGKGIN